MRSRLLCAAGLTIAIVAAGSGKGGTGRFSASTTNNNAADAHPAGAAGLQARGSNELAAQGNAEVNANAVTALRDNLIGKATSDGALVMGVKSQGPCKTLIMTSRGPTIIDWGEAGNLTPRTGGGKDTTTIDVGGKHLPLSIPSGDLADRVNMSLGVLTLNCGGEG